MFDIKAYIMGLIRGKAEGEKNVVITGAVTCTDDGQGNIIITEVE